MITKLTDQEVITLGRRFRAGFLIEQGNLTVAMAKQEGQALLDLVPQGYLDEVDALIKQVAAAGQDKALVADEAKESTNVHHAATRDAHVWERKVARCANRGKHLGEPIPDALTATPRAANGPGLLTQVSEKLTLLQAHKDALPGNGVDALIQEGTAIALALQTGDTQRDLKHRTELPANVVEFRRQKGLLYVALKVINEAGQELHAADPVAASRYNLSILHRRGPRRAGEPEPSPAPAPAAAPEPALVK